jgi:AcrR family transcriptional regulator
MNDSGKLSQRSALLDAARRAVEESGPEVLRARAVTAEIGASTQALYTLFGGMPGLFEAIVADGFADFARYVSEVPEGEDAVADFFAKGWAYSEWALSHPQLYRLMFGLIGGGLRRHAGLEVVVAGTAANSPQAQAAVDVLVRSMTRVVDSGRVDPVDPVLAAAQFLSATHGYLLLEIAGVVAAASEDLGIVRELAVNLMVGLGDDRVAATRSLGAAEVARTEAMGATSPPAPSA